MQHSKSSNEYIFFLSRGFLSPWYSCDFVIDGKKYTSVEQYMMAQKALFFNDQVTFKKIMSTDSPSKIKKLGRKVTPFNSVEWGKKKDEIVYKGNLAKFSQNTKLAKKLINTYPSKIIEAGPDLYWGAGLFKDQLSKIPENKWSGKNRQGEIIMKVRDYLIKERRILPLSKNP